MRPCLSVEIHRRIIDSVGQVGNLSAVEQTGREFTVMGRGLNSRPNLLSEKFLPNPLTNFNRSYIIPSKLVNMKKQTLQTIDCVDFCKAMSDNTRQAILRLLQVRGETNVSDIVAAFKLSQPTISHHLGILRKYGLVKTRHEGKEVLYNVDQDNITECCGLLMSRFEVVLTKGVKAKA
jgi:DNA-binding transcriptional ArsR family regulator